MLAGQLVLGKDLVVCARHDMAKKLALVIYKPVAASYSAPFAVRRGKS